MLQKGIVAKDQGSYETAYELFSNALRLQLQFSEAQQDIPVLLRTYNLMGLICINMGRIEQAQGFFEQGLKVMEKEEAAGRKLMHVNSDLVPRF